ncbi:TetR/AcrR family transcriptional regulator [Streptomyces rapamycinicus]|uniref:Transcriptional regulator n=2 Tax=Streptomyces rapamycinicus TaxID=1226757 RepID=A0A0A0NF95_STRRN|nr:TetR/AcrR family transcriptional regulator [Streptomyces rapamycinicus]AGP58152.1 transcriptional regulator [Streptomyces rapamycinicus NRRL 5491]MBB4785828.1 AcrR family transcriptional regulator [Streptomyces rapamycinicus]RLV78708.1 transcriptional regulator [Streptomyces rapamycinicus NRRL 5491]UTO65980.1 TetR/AcrR family transcriptional regulator [Streptomyces rapamycinicus]UTP33934.1 TetR/AcrR family transcriptional regulator [Streptomyces rapamycinicus NRRL 5491]
MARPRAFDEKQVLNAVREQFWNAGYAATSLEDLMRVSGLGKGSLYAAFGDKRQLFLRALRSYTDDIHGQLREALAAAPRAVDALRMLLEAPIGDPTGTGTGTRRGCLMANSTCELGNADPEVLAHAHRTYETSTALIGDCVARAQREGDLPAGADPIELARALLAAQQGIVFMGRTGLDTATLTATARSLAAQLLPDHSGD